MNCTIGLECTLLGPSVSGGPPDWWSSSPNLPIGLAILSNGSIYGYTSSISDSNHTISAQNSGGKTSVSIRVISLPLPPSSLDYGSQEIVLTYGAPVSLLPSTSGGEPSQWHVWPSLPDGLTLGAEGKISGAAQVLQETTPYVVTATNSAGSVETHFSITVIDLPVWDLEYPISSFELSVGEPIGAIFPEWAGGAPTSWEIHPPLPSGLHFDHQTGSISGSSDFVHLSLIHF